MRRIKIAKILRNESDFLAKYFLSKLSEILNFNTCLYQSLYSKHHFCTTCSNLISPHKLVIVVEWSINKIDLSEKLRLIWAQSQLNREAIKDVIYRLFLNIWTVLNCFIFGVLNIWLVFFFAYCIILIWYFSEWVVSWQD